MAAGRIYDRLITAFRSEYVFMDVDTIPPGVDFRQYLTRQVENADVMLVLIGKQWLHITDESGTRRLDNPSDFVHIEVEAGLNLPDCMVIPVLLGNTPMPRADELPPALEDLAFRNAVVIRDNPDFNRDVERLIQWVRAIDADNQSTQSGLTRITRSSRIGWAIGAVVAIALIVAILMVLSMISGDDGGNAPDPSAVDTQVALEPAETATQMTSETSTKSPTSSLTPTDTLTYTPTLSDAEYEQTIQAEMVLVQTENAETAQFVAAQTSAAVSATAETAAAHAVETADALTLTATSWTRTPTPDPRETAYARLTATQAALNEQATAAAHLTATQWIADQTATARAWTDTPTPTFTLTPTPTFTVEPTATPTNTPVPTVMPMWYNEAPMLAELVAAGKLPPVEERLPVNPRVVGFDDSEIGVYGGIWHRAWRGVNDYHCYGRVNYDPVLRWPRDPSDPVQPGLAERWEFSEDGTELTLYFREGLKWSDGVPWTVDDVIFWWEYIENDPEITVAVHSEWQTLTHLIKVDDYTITLRFSTPNGLAETVGLAFHGNQWPLWLERFGFYAPKHYLEQFHPALSDDSSYEDFENAAYDYNVDRPVMTAWKIVEYGTDLMIAERNPYYYAVDREGNQLPYIDYQYYHYVEDGTTGVNLMGISGELDMQARAIDLAQYPVYLENADAGDYHLLLWPNAQPSSLTLWFNMSYEDPQYRALFQNLAFRQAMSLAIDRETLNEIVFWGQGVPRTETVVPDSPFYQADIENIYGEYNFAEARRLLEEDVGLVMGDNGYYTFADGSELGLIIESRWSSGQEADGLEIIAEWWTALGVWTEHESMTREVYWPRATGNEVMVATWTTDRGLQPMVDPIYLFPFDERSWMGPNFGLWYKSGGVEGEAPPEFLQEAMALYDLYKVTTDSAEQIEIGKQIVRLSTEGLWTIGTVGLIPNPVVVKNNFGNVPDHYTTDWIVMSPGPLEPSIFYISD